MLTNGSDPNKMYLTVLERKITQLKIKYRQISFGAAMIIIDDY